VAAAYKHDEEYKHDEDRHTRRTKRKQQEKAKLLGIF
jgi:hypothetical protein